MADPAPRPDTTRLQRLVHSYRDAATLMATVEVGLFAQVARGADCYYLVAAQRHPALRAVVVDLPSVVEVTREFIASHGLSDRVSARAGDCTRDPLPAGADVMEMASNLPQYVRESLQGPALRGLAEALWGSTGIAHLVGECRGYFERAGARDVAAHELVPGVLTRVTGRRP
jgi:hypothetical protein